MGKNSLVLERREAIRNELTASYCELKKTNDFIRLERREGANIDGLAELLSRQAALFEKIEHLRKQSLPPIVQAVALERKQQLPGEIEKLEKQKNKLRNELDALVREGIVSLLTDLIVLGARVSSSGLTLPEGFGKFLSAAQQGSRLSPIGLAEAQLQTMRLELNRPVNVSNLAETENQHAIQAAQKQSGFDAVADFARPFYGGHSIE